MDAHLLKVSAATHPGPHTAKVTNLSVDASGAAKVTYQKLPKPVVKLPSKTEATFLKIASSGLHPCGIIPLKPDRNLHEALNTHPEVSIETFANSLLAPGRDNTTPSNADTEHDSKLSLRIQNTAQDTPLVNREIIPSLGPNFRSEVQTAQSTELVVPGDNGVTNCETTSSVMKFYDRQNASALPKRQHVLGDEMNYTFVANSLYSATRSGMTVADRTVLETELSEKTCQYIDPTNPLMKRTLTHLHWYSNPSLNALYSDTTPLNHFKVLNLHSRTRHMSPATAPFGGGFSMDTLQRYQAAPIQYGDELDDDIMAKAIASDLQSPESEDFKRHIDADVEFSEKQNRTRVQKPCESHEDVRIKSRKRSRQFTEEDRQGITTKCLKLHDESTQSSGEFPAYCSLADSTMIQSDIAAQAQVFALSLLDPDV